MKWKNTSTLWYSTTYFSILLWGENTIDLDLQESNHTRLVLHYLAVAEWNDGPDVVELRNSCSAAASVKPVCQNQNAEDALLGQFPYTSWWYTVTTYIFIIVCSALVVLLTLPFVLFSSYLASFLLQPIILFSPDCVPVSPSRSFNLHHISSSK